MIVDELTQVIRNAVLAARDAGEITLLETDFAVKLEMPPNKQFGDYSSNIALTLKKATGITDSRIIAEVIRRRVGQAGDFIDHVEVAGPGFLNFYLKPTWLYDGLKRIESENRDFGKSNTCQGEKILVEFVSANPTGPISVVNGRAAALGDVLANLLAAQGCLVSREFYINDALNSLQLDTFSRTVMARYLQQLGCPLKMPDGDIEAGFKGSVTTLALAFPDPVLFPERGYLGDYVRDIAKTIVAEVGDKYAYLYEFLTASSQSSTTKDEAYLSAETFFREATLYRMVDAQREALLAFGVHYDRWFFESSLYTSGEVDATIRTLIDRGYTYLKDGALWLKSSELGDTEDRVLIRSNEKATYVAADAAYHADKFNRGNTRLIDIFGADHHGYIARLKAGISALGYDLKNFHVILTQMVSLVRDGETVIGGKRKGNLIELKEDLIDDIGRDAARFYFLLNSYETPTTVDVELAKRQSNENPVYYVQYAHARLCNILHKADEQGIILEPASKVDCTLLVHEREIDVLRKLTDFPDEVSHAAEKYAPHRLTRYAIDLAGMLNLFYENCRVLPGKEDNLPIELTKARLALVNSARIVLHNLFDLLGISAPERMDRLDTLDG